MDAYEMAKAAGAFGVADELERLKVEYAAAIERGMRATAELQGKAERLRTALKVRRNRQFDGAHIRPRDQQQLHLWAVLESASESLRVALRGEGEK